MADLADVENALQTLITNVVYPTGSSNPSIVAPSGVKIYRGWPLPADLDNDLATVNPSTGAAQIPTAHISIFSQPNVETNTTRYPREDQVQTAPVHTLTASVAGNQVTIGGTVSVPQNAIVICGPYNFPYSVQSGDTLNSIAAALAALVAVKFPGTSSSGPVITIAASPGIVRARIGGVGTIWTEQGRQWKGFVFTCWCPTPTIRDILAPPIDVLLRQNDFITLADQSAARLRYESTAQIDDAQKVLIYRRDLRYMVEYATATVTPATEAINLAISSGPPGFVVQI